MSILRNNLGTLTWAFATLTLALVGCSSGTKNNGQTNAACQQGETQECVGPGACKGAQVCMADSSWSTCDCGTSGTGGAGTGGNGNTSATTSSTTDVGGNTSVNGGATSAGGTTAAPAGGTTGAATTAAATGGATAGDTGGASSGATGGATAGDTGGASSGATGGATSAAGGITSTLATGTAPGPTGGATSAATGGAPPATGGATSAATGGSSSLIPNVGGATGVGGASTAGGSSANPYLVSEEGWIIDSAHNLQGPIYTYTDDGGSRITPDCTTDDCFAPDGVTTSFCVNGKVAQALDAYGENCQMNSTDCDWSTYWGASMAINLNQVPPATEGAAWDASGYTGVSFKTTVDTMPPSLRIYLKLTDDTQFCYELTSSSKSYTVPWSQFYTDCYTTGGVKPTSADLKKVESIVWQAGNNASAAGSFDFCISDVKITP
jgi:hypothetical protein